MGPDIAFRNRKIGSRLTIFINGVNHEQDLEGFLLENLKEGGVADGSKRFTSKVVDVLLDLGHAGNVV